MTKNHPKKFTKENLIQLLERQYINLVTLAVGSFIGAENQRSEKVVFDYRFPFSLTRGCSNRHALNTNDIKRQQIENSTKA